MRKAVARPAFLLLTGLALLSGCGKGERNEPQGAVPNRLEPGTVDIPQTVEKEAPGTTPMGQRVAVIGLLNKRNGISQELTLKPGQAQRIGDVIVRLRACETTAPWEPQTLTGAFVQLDVRDPQGQFRRVVSGWLYKESPSLNVVEHPVYDVWPKSCAMTHPDAAADTVRAGSEASNRSSAANSPAQPSAPAAGAGATPPPTTAPSGTASDNRAR